MKKIINLFVIVLLMSNTIRAINTPALNAPTDNATNRPTSVNIDWYGVVGNAGYLYEVDTVPTFNSPIYIQGASSVNSSNMNLYNLRFGQTYYWRAATKSSIDTSAWSATWSFTTLDAVILDSPVNNATNRPTSVNIDWYGMTGNAGYMYEVDTVPTFNSSAYIQGVSSVNSSNMNLYNLRFGQTYYWRAAIKNSIDTSAWSATWSFTTLDTVILDSPVNNATNRPTSVNIDWYGMTGNAGYMYEVDTVPTFNSSAYIQGVSSVNSSNMNLYNLRFGQTYYWRAAIKNSIDTSAWSATWSFTTLDTVILDSPVNNATNRPTSVNIDWYAMTGNAGYMYEVDTVPTFNSSAYIQGVSSVNSSNMNLYNLRFGQTYYWRAAIKNSIDTSAWSATWSFTTLDAVILDSPVNNATNRPTSVNIDWYAMTGNAGYMYEVDTVPTFNSSAYIQGVSSVNSSNMNLYNLRFGQTYYWRAAIKNSIDTSAWSATWSFTTLDTVILDSPVNNATNRPTSLNLDWYAMSGNAGYLYEVDVTPSFNSGQLLSGATNTNSSNYTVSGLLNGTTYYWRAAIKNSVDTSKWSAPWSFTTQYLLTSAPTLLTPTNTSTGILQNGQSFTWTSVATASSYEIVYSQDNTFSTGVLSSITSSTNKTINGLSSGSTYYWRVRAQNASGNSPWSTIWSFSTAGSTCEVFNTVTESSCGNYNFNGTLLTSSGVFVDTLNGASCDSIVTLNLTILNAVNSTDIITACTSYNWIDGLTYTTSTTAPTYTYSGGAANGCDSVVTLDLTILNAVNSIDIVSTCTSYSWIDGVTYTASTTIPTHTYSGGAANGCDSVVTLNLTINNVNTSVSLNAETLTANETGASYQWLDCNNGSSSINGATSQSYTATTNGNYAVVITKNSCSDTSICTTISTVGIDEANLFEGVRIFPNPTSGILNVKFTTLLDARLSMYSISGRIVFTEQSITSDSFTYELKEASGVYFLKVETEGASKIYKVVKF